MHQPEAQLYAFSSAEETQHKICSFSLLLKGSIQPRPQLLAETHQAKARGKGHRALWILYETKCSGEPERRKQANKKWKTNSLYKTLFKPQMQVTFVILNPFFILLERPQLIKAEREFIQTCVTTLQPLTSFLWTISLQKRKTCCSTLFHRESRVWCQRECLQKGII